MNDWMAWIDVGEEVYVLPLRHENIIVEPDGHFYKAALYTPDGEFLKSIATGAPGKSAMLEAQFWVRSNRKADLDLVDPNASWRTQPATAEQRAHLKRAHIAHSPELTAGEGATLITRHIIGSQRRVRT